MSRRIAILPSSIHPPLARYSHAVLTEGCTRSLQVSGQLAIGPDGDVPAGADAQAQLCFRSIDAILVEAGMVRSDVVKISAYVTSRDAFGLYMPVRDDWIRNLAVPPASTVIIVSGFTRSEFCVEIEVVACQT